MVYIWQFLYYHVVEMNIFAIRVIHYILHSYVRVLLSLSKPLFCFPRMVNTRSTPAAQEQGEASGAEFCLIHLPC